MRKFLHNLQPSSGGKENLVGAGRTPQDTQNDGNAAKLEQKLVETAANVVDDANEKVTPSMYQKLILEDLTSTDGPSERYWKVLAERRRKALVEVLQDNRRLIALVKTLEEENMSCKLLIENTTELVNTLKEVINESQSPNDDEDVGSSNNLEDSGWSIPDGYSSDEHIHKKMKISTSDVSSDSD